MLESIKRRLFNSSGATISSRAQLQTPLSGIRPPKKSTHPTFVSRFPPLSDTFAGTPNEGFNVSLDAPKTRITTLNNGLRVATEDSYSQMAAIGLYIQCGTRFEPSEKPCISYLLERLAFKSTKNRTASKLIQECEYIGANIVTASDKENICYSMITLRDCLPQAIDILADSLLNPLFTQEEIDEQLMAIETEQENLQQYDFIIPQIMHKIAYSGHPLSTSLKELYPTLRQNISRDDLIEYREKHFVGNRMVISGASVDHEEFVNLTSHYFNSLLPSSKSEIKEIPKQYTGGFHYETLPLKYLEDPAAKNYFAIGFESAGWIHDDCYAMAVLGKILGGGSAFSAGGPGKGVFSRMYTRIMNQFGWVESAEALITCYVDTGLFGIYSSCQQGHLGELIQEVCLQLFALVNDPLSNPSEFATELYRAQNQLKSSIFTNLEQRSILFDDIGRQVLIYGKRFSADEVCRRIDGVTIEECIKVALKILTSNPTVVVFGSPADMAQVVPYEIIQQFFQSNLSPLLQHIKKS